MDILGPHPKPLRKIAEGHEVFTWNMGLGPNMHVFYLVSTVASRRSFSSITNYHFSLGALPKLETSLQASIYIMKFPCLATPNLILRSIKDSNSLVPSSTKLLSHAIVCLSTIALIWLSKSTEPAVINLTAHRIPVSTTLTPLVKRTIHVGGAKSRQVSHTWNSNQNTSHRFAQSGHVQGVTSRSKYSEILIWLIAYCGLCLHCVPNINITPCDNIIALWASNRLPFVYGIGHGPQGFPVDLRDQNVH